ncbi:MAG: hypothetical protein HC788_14960, partial [Sphingopyxis sp.]|nr:hypothetical protein [Sphingopyxis sp.]
RTRRAADELCRQPARLSGRRRRAGDGNNNAAGAGGVGGGLIFLLGQTLAGSGQVRANGGNGANTVPGHNDAPGGVGRAERS